LPKLKKLFALVSIAFACCLDVGIYKHEYEKPLKKKKHGYKAKSFFRYGLDEIRRALLHLHHKADLALTIIDRLFYRLQENLNWANTLDFILRL